MKRDGFLFTVFLAVISVILIRSNSGARELKKIEKIIPIKRTETLLVSLKIDVGELNVHKNNESEQVFISVQYDDERDQIEIDFDEDKNELFILVDRDRWFKSRNDQREPKLEISLPGKSLLNSAAKLKPGKLFLILNLYR